MSKDTPKQGTTRFPIHPFPPYGTYGRMKSRGEISRIRSGAKVLSKLGTWIRTENGSHWMAGKSADSWESEAKNSGPFIDGIPMNFPVKPPIVKIFPIHKIIHLFRGISHGNPILKPSNTSIDTFPVPCLIAIIPGNRRCSSADFDLRSIPSERFQIRHKRWSDLISHKYIETYSTNIYIYILILYSIKICTYINYNINILYNIENMYTHIYIYAYNLSIYIYIINVINSTYSK